MSKLQLKYSPGRLLKRLRVLIIGLLVLSAYEYFEHGAVTWPAGTLNHIADYASRPDAAWRKASDAFNEAVPAEGVPTTFDLSGRVVRVVDSDTVSLLDSNNVQHKIRFHGVDTPEHGQPFGKAAAKTLSGLVAGENVGVETKDVDQYGRIVGVLWLDGRNINLEMVKSGYAWWYRQYARYDVDLRDAEKSAREGGRGLWADPDPVPPWEWRRERRR